MFFDFHLHGDYKLAREAEKLGYHGVALVVHSKDCKKQAETLKDLRKTIIKDGNQDDGNSFSLQLGVEIDAKNPEDLKKQVKKFRKNADILLVHGGNLKINRAATEDPRIDILSHPYRNRYDSGINHVLAVKAAENKVAVEINLKYFLLTRPNQRHRVLNQFQQIVKLHRKYQCPVIITSDASSIYGLRNPRDVMAMAPCFGMKKEETLTAMSAIPQEIVERNKIRDQVIVQGVRLIK
jgi:ribonuclease P/MRP protein subunit RPP1